MRNYYKVLGINEYESDQKVIRYAYFKKLMYYDPSRHNTSKRISERKFLVISKAYDVLSNEDSKNEYDSLLRSNLIKEYVLKETRYVFRDGRYQVKKTGLNKIFDKLKR